MFSISAEFTRGDPHFKTADNKTYTFNGIGEYILVRTPTQLNFHVQIRMERFSTSGTGTVITAVVIKKGEVDPVQVESGENGELILYIGGIEYDLPKGESPIIVTAAGVISSDVTGGISSLDNPMTMAMMTEQISVSYDEDDGLLVNTGDGVHVAIAQQMTFLRLSIELSENYLDETSGLFGVYNGDPDDDYRNRDGDILVLNTEQELYQEFGLECKYYRFTCLRAWLCEPLRI